MKTIVVTGASGNLGSAVIKKFLQEEYRVIGTTTKPAVTEFDDHPGFESFAVDLTDESATSSFVASLLTKYPVIDAAVFTAGGFAMGKIEESGIGEIMGQYKLNFLTTYNPARMIFAHMLQQKKGRLFMTGAKAGLDMKQGKGVTGYALSKSLVFRLAELMNEEAKNTAVVSHVVVPSTIDTPQNRKAMPGADFSKWVQAQDIAAIIYTHCSDSFAALREPVIKVYNGA